jgi:hypothetical protein
MNNSQKTNKNRRLKKLLNEFPYFWEKNLSVKIKNIKKIGHYKPASECKNPLLTFLVTEAHHHVIDDSLLIFFELVNLLDEANAEAKIPLLYRTNTINKRIYKSECVALCRRLRNKVVAHPYTNMVSSGDILKKEKNKIKQYGNIYNLLNKTAHYLIKKIKILKNTGYLIESSFRAKVIPKIYTEDLNSLKKAMMNESIWSELIDTKRYI